MISTNDGPVDEPTVVSRRPIGPTKSARTRRNDASDGQAWSGDDPQTPARGRRADGDTPVQPSSRQDQFQPALLVPVSERPKYEDDALVAASVPLLIVVAHLRNAVQQADVSALRKEMAEQLRRFEERAVRFGARAGDVNAARYVLCSLIDEAVMTTPWGSSSTWSTNSLLLEFHSETWGGEKVFTILDRVRGEPQKYLALLKLIDVCLLLGFEGKYRVVEGGREQLADLRTELGRLLRQLTRPLSNELSSAWRGVRQTRSLRNYVPLWIVFSFAGVLLLLSYGLMKWRVVAETAPAEQALTTIAGTN